MGDALDTMRTMPLSSIGAYWGSRRRVETVAVARAAPTSYLSSTVQTDVRKDADVEEVDEGGTEKEDRTENMVSVQVTILISMPSPFHPHFHSQTSSISTSPIAGEGDERRTSSDRMQSVALFKRAINDTCGGLRGAFDGGSKGDDEEMIPVVEIGVASVTVRDWV